MSSIDNPKQRFPLRSQLAEGVVLERPPIERPELGTMPTDLIERMTEEMPTSRGAPGGSDLPDMAPAAEITGAPVRGDAGDQQAGPPVRKAPAPSKDEGYVRLRIHVEDGDARVTGVTHVEGPLVTANSAGGGYVWEVVVDGERVAADALGDMSEWRSFPDPEATGGDERRGHHVTDLSSFDFTARVPAGELRTGALDRAEVGVYRVKDAERPLPFLATRRPLRQEFARELREVARLPALDERYVGDELAGRLRGMLPD